MKHSFSGSKLVLLDIEGTICSISFVKDVLFPYALSALPAVLSEQWTSTSLAPFIADFPAEHRSSPAALQAHVGDLTARDVKVAYLKNLQGYLWRTGYESGAYSTELFADVEPQLRAWRDAGYGLAIFSSGSVAAQKLLFQHVKTADGTKDLTALMDGWFDTVNAGSKIEGSSYSLIAKALGRDTTEVLFLSDNVKEVRAAKQAGMQALVVEREGNALLTDADRQEFQIVQSLSEVVLEDHSDEQPRKKVKLQETAEADASVIESVQRQAVTDQLEQEAKFGITAFATETTGFSCILKKRYTDFLVNEIRPGGQVTRLTGEPAANGNAAQQSKPETVSKEATVAVEEKVEKQNGSTDSTTEAPKDLDDAPLSDEHRTQLEGIFGAETTKALAGLYAKILAHPFRKPRDHPQHTSEVIDDKQKRTDAHIAVRNIFKAKIDTTTAEDNRIHIKAASPAKQSGKQTDRRSGPSLKGKVGWDELGGEYLHFSLYKENKDTMEVLYFLASQMKMQTRHFQFAGTKDRRGVTVQRVSLYRVTKERLQSLNKSLRQARMSDFEYKKHGLQLGELSGNEFTIVLRDCHPLDGTSSLQDTVSAAVEAMRLNGFLNYFGLQRFGTFSTSTDDVGRRMLKGDFKGAVEGILKFNPALAGAVDASSKVSRDDQARAQALQTWFKTQKAGPSVDGLPRRFQAENAIIRHLGHIDKRSGKQLQLEDWQGALQQITRNLRLMYVHAYQSLVWNAVAARRRELYGAKVVEGDLVIVEQKAANTGPKDEVDDEGEVIIRPTGDDSATAAEDRFERARPLSAEEAASGRYTIFDVVLPMPGYDVAYPANEVAGFYKEFMGRDGLDPDNMRRSWRDISLSGSYRKVVARAEALSFEVRNYSEEDEQLVQTDLEKLDGQDSLGPSTGPRSAVVIKMQLGTSQYATMALRELTKGGALAFKPEYSVDSR